MRIHNRTKNVELAANATLAASYWSRLVGLLGRKGLAEGEALVLEPCNSVHTMFMRFTIDVLYLDKERRVVKAVPSLKPFRVSAAFRGAHSVVELPEGVIAATSTAPGDEVTLG
jgi:uncharacterized membrane protein (UPF0127 family)